MRGRHSAGRPGPVAAAAVAVASAALAGCAFNLPPKTKPHPTHPGSQSWLQGLSVHITSANAIDFQNWSRSHDAPGPYAQAFVLDGHRTHYHAFGATWLRKGSLWVPAHTARNDPVAQRTSLYAWSLWAAAQDRLPPLVCGTAVTSAGLQAQIFGPSGNPW